MLMWSFGPLVVVHAEDEQSWRGAVGGLCCEGETNDLY